MSVEDAQSEAKERYLSAVRSYDLAVSLGKNNDADALRQEIKRCRLHLDELEEMKAGYIEPAGPAQGVPSRLARSRPPAPWNRISSL